MMKFLDMELTTSPHFRRGMAVPQIMRNVIYALLPVVAVAVYTFGTSAALLIAVTTLTCVVVEWMATWHKKENTLVDGSAILTGLLLGLTLPPGFPLWMGVVGGIVSILLGKTLFGGLGCNVFNPALVGRAFLQAAFPTAITTWTDPFLSERFAACIPSSLATTLMKAPDMMTSATALSRMKFDHAATPVTDLLLGHIAGSTGETCAIVILLGGVYLALRKMLDWRIPIGIFATVGLFSGLLHMGNAATPGPLFMWFSGGLMLGAVFMATDMVTSPVTSLGVWIYAALIGLLVVAIRVWGGLPEGVMYAILLGNAFTPMINRYTQPRVYGTKGRA